MWDVLRFSSLSDRFLLSVPRFALRRIYSKKQDPHSGSKAEKILEVLPGEILMASRIEHSAGITF
ncbi:hypothetical protein AMJ82_02635 [candidate division TA06 bacterium SM23_40]|uniref:Uncharacterized protein n=1 Tax=candidate division TA06 bacterium SM23_40 TaxID=1703774 RepID=A0A0S8GEE3_UNCT6|nr:MAG: hypothetical protein AMJ82_02635 [candidate division TA06 bacterium SM23_40]